MSTTMQLVFASDARFASRTAVAIHSILENTSRHASITIMTDGVPDLIARSFERICEGHGADLRIIAFERSLVADLPVFHPRMSCANYFRLFLPEIMPDTIDKVLYLDSDIVCRGDIAPLWDTELGDVALGAVRDFMGARLRTIISSREIRRRSESATQFNSGVLLINLRKWREMKVGEAALAWRRANPDFRQSHDQAALNAVLAHDWQQLSARWNFGTWFLFYTHYASARHRRLLNPVIIHYSRHLGRLPYDSLFDKHYRTCATMFGWPPSYRPLPDPRTPRQRLVARLRELHRHLVPSAYGRALEFAEGRPRLGHPSSVAAAFEPTVRHPAVAAS